MTKRVCQLLEWVAAVDHRLQVAGADAHPRFDRRAVDIINEFARGMPRQVNAVCDMALLAAYGQGEADVGVDAARAAIESSGAGS